MQFLYISLGRLGEGLGFGPYSGDLSNPGAVLETILSKVIGFMTICGGIWFIFQFITGAYGWMSSAGDKAAVKAAQDRITHAVTGLVIVVAAYALISVIGSLLGISILNPATTIQNINP